MIRAISCAPPPRERDLFRFLFVGSLGVYANEDAVLYFCEHILPMLEERTPRGPLSSISWGPFPRRGSAPSRRMPAYTWWALSPTMRPWYEAADAVIVPLRTGGGTRIKILEAISYRRPVVTTALGTAKDSACATRNTR